MVSKACVVGAYQTKLEAIGKAVDLTVVVPPYWQEARGNLTLERSHTDHYNLRVLPMRLNGRYHLHYYPDLPELLYELKPDILHMDEEPYSFVTWHGMRVGRKLNVKLLFFSWQNILRRYPPPFRWMERQILNWSHFGIMGNAAADQVWRSKGFRGASAVFPQFGVSMGLFTPRESCPARPFTIGSANRRLNPEKGVDLILQAATQLNGNWCVKIAGDGGARDELVQMADRLGIANRVHFLGKIGSEAVPDFLRSLDVLVLSSRTLPTWKEQFGRVLTEAMACEVAVIGSDSGEIPHVIGDAGLIFREDDVDGLRAHLQLLQEDGALRGEFGRKGRQRVLQHYTQDQIASKTVAVYRSLNES
jgi:glycosyltransferase involved in cell wall biosynthesis